MIERTKKIGEVCRLVNGRAFKPSDWTKDGLRIIRIQNLNNESAPFNLYDGAYEPKHKVGDGDVLLSWSGTPGTSFGCFVWNRGEALLNQHIFLVHVNEEIYDKDYFVFAVNSELAEMIHQAHGAVGLRHITKGRLEAMDIPFIPKKEQVHVVGQIKECLSRVEEMQRLRSESEGERARLLSATLRELFDEAAATGRPSTVGAVTLSSQYGTNVKCSGECDGTPILRIPNVAGGHVNLEKMKFARLADRERAKVRLENGDLLVVRTNGSPDLVGRCAVFKEQAEYGYASYLIRFRLNQGETLADYLSFFLQSPQGRDAIARIRQTSAGQYNVNSENLRNIVFPLVKPAAQAALVEKALAVQRIADSIGGELDRTETETDILRESILREAFAGYM
jgi:type I restriction enzyme, S subunit